MHDIAEEILHYGRLLITKGLVTGSGGNISHRLPEGNKILITPSGMSYDKLVLDDLVVLDIASGEVVSGHRKPSIEQGMHRAIYLHRPDVNAVIHCHSKYATAVATTRKDFPPALDNMVTFFGGGVKTARHAAIGTPELAKHVIEALGDAPVALLANHGSVAVAKRLDQAFTLAELLEECAMVYLLSFLAGGPVVLTDEEVEHERNWLSGKYGLK
ncbi:class II aldolase/adducin family protein [Heliobacterium mobile]|nr:class II aldolase/adducin family protein [Heliobacterium mobile]